MTPRQKESERERFKSETKARLIQAAADEIAREGYNGANINRISREAGFAKGTIYNYFPSKRELMAGLIDDFAEKHYAWIAEQVTLEEDPVRRMEIFFQSGFSFVKENFSQAWVMLLTIFGPDEQFKQLAYEKYQPLLSLVSQEILAYGIDLGEFRPMDAENVAKLVMTFYLGTASSVDAQGRFWLDPLEVARFVIHGLKSSD